MNAGKAVLFDLGYTLEKPVSGHWFLSSLFYQYYPKEQLASILSPEAMAAYEKKSFAYLKAHNTVQTAAEEEAVFVRYFTDFVSGLPGLTITPERAAELAHDRVTNYAAYALLDGAREALATLKKDGYRLALVSDTWPSFCDQLDAIGILPYFDAMTVSYQLGVTKPDPRMFLDALAKLAVRPQEAFFVDDLAVNLEAAEKLGMHPVQSLADERLPHDPRWPGIHCPREILPLLAAWPGR